jgi:AcrR family transcriptional regulator
LQSLQGSQRGNSISSLSPVDAPNLRREGPVGRAKRTRDRAGKQEALIQSALSLFARKGYEATTTREIAASAGCAEGLIHRYFKGKAGLLPALVERQFTKEVVDLNRELQPAATLQSEFIQLVLWEVDRFWETRDFMKVFVPRALVDASLAGVKSRMVISVRAKVVLERLRRFECCSRLPRQELDALAQSVGMLGMVFGFMRPLVLGHDRFQSRQMARAMAEMLIRSVTFAAANNQFS